MDDPVFSVVVCTYNGAETLQACIESLLAQDFSEPYEVLVVDDGSTDATPDIVGGFDDDRLTLIQHDTNQGLGTARNTGWQNASGEYVAYIDDDAEAPGTWLQTIYDTYDDGVDGVGGYPETYYDDLVGRYEVARTIRLYGEEAENIDGGGGMNMSFRRSVLDAVGGFDERFTHIGDDADINHRLTEAGYTLVVDPDITIQHKFPRAIKPFTRKMFKRGLGRAVFNEKYRDETLLRYLFLALIAPFAVPYAVWEGVQLNKHSSKWDVPGFTLLAYLNRVATYWGTVRYMLK